MTLYLFFIILTYHCYFLIMTNFSSVDFHRKLPSPIYRWIDLGSFASPVQTTAYITLKTTLTSSPREVRAKRSSAFFLADVRSKTGRCGDSLIHSQRKVSVLTDVGLRNASITEL